MRNFITGLFLYILGVTTMITLIVGVLWLFDYKPNSLYLVWDICCKSLIISFLFWLLFGKRLEDNNGWIKIENKQNEEQYFNEKREMFVLTENGDIFIFNHYKHLSNVGKITHFKPIENPKPPIY